MADEHHGVGQLWVLGHRGHERCQVVERARHPATRHPGPAVLTDRHVEARLRQRDGLRPGVAAVVGGAPEAAVDDEHRGTGTGTGCRFARQAHVIDLGGVDAVGAKRVGGGEDRRSTSSASGLAGMVTIVAPVVVTDPG